MTAVFLGERDSAGSGSYDMGAASAQHTPPEYGGLDVQMMRGFDGAGGGAVGRRGGYGSGGVDAWLELWDYAGGCDFRGFVAGTGDKRCLFTFFDRSVINRDLKQALMEIIDLASDPLDCAQVVVCLDRSFSAEDTKALLKSLRWVGFELVTLDLWAGTHTGPSEEWLFLGMEV